MYSSGQMAGTVEKELTCSHCAFEGLVEWVYDPEYDQYTIGTQCPACFVEIEEVIE